MECRETVINSTQSKGGQRCPPFLRFETAAILDRRCAARGNDGRNGGDGRLPGQKRPVGGNGALAAVMHHSPPPDRPRPVTTPTWESRRLIHAHQSVRPPVQIKSLISGAPVSPHFPMSPSARIPTLYRPCVHPDFARPFSAVECGMDRTPGVLYGSDLEPYSITMEGRVLLYC